MSPHTKKLPAGFNDPIVFPDVFSLTFSEELAQDLIRIRSKEIDRIRAHKLAALIEYYELDSADQNFWQKLALTLAFEHVPGFQVGKCIPKGRRKAWHVTDHYALWYEVTSLVSVQEAKNAHEACGILWKKEHWFSKVSPVNTKLAQSQGRKRLYDQFLFAQTSDLVTLAQRNCDDDKSINRSKLLEDLYHAIKNQTPLQIVYE